MWFRLRPLRQWPINQKRVFGACCKAVVWNRKRDGLEITLVPHSAIEDDEDDEPLTP